MKECVHCGLTKPLTDFPIGKRCKDGHKGRCKECVKLFVKSRGYKNRSLPPEIQHRNDIARKYGLLPVEERRLLHLANHQCQVCSNKTDLTIDHNHVTGAIRGILCRKCNSALGLVKDDAELLLKLIGYLKNAPTTVNMLGLLNSMAGPGGV